MAQTATTNTDTAQRGSNSHIAKIVALFSALLIALTACGGSDAAEETKTVLKGNIGGVESTITYYSINDEVTRQTTENVMPYSSLNVTSADEARQLLDPMAESFQGIDGLQHGFEYRDDAVVETLSIDYSTADVEKIAELPGSDFSGNLESGKVSLKESLKAFEGQGYTKVEG